MDHLVKKCIAAGYWHVTDLRTGERFWVARVARVDLDPNHWRRAGRIVWQIGEIDCHGYEDAPFDAGNTLAECLQYINPPTG